MVNTSEVKNYEDLKNSETVKNDENLKRLTKEIDEIKDSTNKNDDKIDGVFAETAERTLNQGLLDSLNKQDISTLQILVGEVGRINRDPNLNLDADVKKSLEDLINLLSQVLNNKHNQGLIEQGEQVQESQNQSFDKFKSMIEGKNEDGTNTLNKLNSLSDNEMNNVLNFVKDLNNKSLVFDLYYKMEKVNKPDNFKKTDRKNFDTVLDTIKVTYPELKEHGMDAVGESQLNELFPENLTADDLNQILRFHSEDLNFVWNGSNIIEEFSFKNKDGEHFDDKKFMDKFNNYNEKRVKSVEDKGNEIINELDIDGLSYDKENGKFMKDGKEVGFKELSGVDESNKYEKGFNLLSINELGENHFKEIREGWENALKQRIEESNEQHENDGNGGFDKSVEKKGDRMTQDRVDKINAFVGENAFLKLDGDSLSYNLDNVKKFLGTINAGNFNKEFIKVGTDSRYAWLSATQILLNQDDTNNLTVDGEYKRGGETYNAVKKFQGEYNESKKVDGKYPEGFEPLVEDGIPGPLTLGKLLNTERGNGVVVNEGGDGVVVNEGGDGVVVNEGGDGAVVNEGGDGAVVNEGGNGAVVNEGGNGVVVNEGGDGISDAVDGNRTYTFANGNEFVGEIKDDKLVRGKLILKENGGVASVDVERDEKGLRIVSNNLNGMEGKYIDENTGCIILDGNSEETLSTNPDQTTQNPQNSGDTSWVPYAQETGYFPTGSDNADGNSAPVEQPTLTPNPDATSVINERFENLAQNLRNNGFNAEVVKRE